MISKQTENQFLPALTVFLMSFVKSVDDVDFVVLFVLLFVVDEDCDELKVLDIFSVSVVASGVDLIAVAIVVEVDLRLMWK